MNLRFLVPSIAVLLLVSDWVRPALAQVPPDEHAKHHPAPAGASAAPAGQAGPAGMPMPGGSALAPAATMTPDGAQAAPNATGGMPGSQPQMAPGAGMSPAAGAGMAGAQPPAAPGGGMAAMMGEMMKQMGTPPRKELYPSLMALPGDVTPEERFRIEQQAHERMTAGVSRLYSSLEKLSASTTDEDFAVMQEATAQMRQGLAEFEAGIAARRVLAEGKVARNVALDWFKREMNLASPVRRGEPGVASSGVTPFHLFTMVLLIAFALAMVAMYFFKMRRAAALFGRLEADANSPPPGAAPPLAGVPGPSAPKTTPPAETKAPGGDDVNAAG